MNTPVYTTAIVSDENDIPFDLLLLADESIEAINKYIYQCRVYIVTSPNNNKPIAVFALLHLNQEEIEIKNIAVATEYQGLGIGSKLIDEIKQLAIDQGYRQIWVGTADCALPEIVFYEKNGFTKAGVKTNFFIDNYPAPIFDNGVMLKDMIMLQMNI
ncbi:GNAT family N-acetyltransferase [Mucilaginibacter celer]|uniref:GNAT family N-acetyltransferase n=1 Tax=Mucilaginibacter celer TaxID=2305508 RepID=A0A494VXJ2_9SPHI|nr:GNAT family N-acetyltransferase [Mucilaginibacter celer]AYL96193.1 GNAT family N-acetyltransferase [Mucilaginibacter celer]